MDQPAQYFSRMISPVDVGEFFGDYWEKKHLFISRDAADFYADALKTTDVDAYFQNQHLSPEFLNVMLDGDHCPPERWTYTAVRVTNNFSLKVVDINKLLKLFNRGATIIINAAETAFASLIALRRALETEMKCFVQANVYITPPDSQGFAPHFDSHNVLILQIHGTKRWNLYDSPVDSPVQTTSVEEFNYQERKPNFTIELNPGDLLYIPRGMVHCARAEKNSSIHVTIGPMLRQWSSLLKLLFKKANDDAKFRRLLPHGLSGESEQSEFEIEFRRNLHELIEKTDWQELQYTNFIEEQRGDNRGKFNDLLKLEQLTAESIVFRRPFLNYLIERDEQWITIHFEGEEIILPMFLENALDKILGEKSFAINQISGIPNDAGKIALVKHFVKTGFLHIIS